MCCIVSYDITDDRRRVKLSKILLDFGYILKDIKKCLEKISISPIIFLPFRTGGNLKIQNAVSKKCKEIIAQVLKSEDS
jgi:hypothetical protein